MSLQILAAILGLFAQASSSHTRAKFHLGVPTSGALHWCEDQSAVKVFARIWLGSFKMGGNFSVRSYVIWAERIPCQYNA